MVMRQRHLPTIPKHRFLCLPVSVGWYWEEPNHVVKRSKGALNEFSIHFVLDGKGYVEIEDKSYTLKQGDAFIYFPYERQQYGSSEEDPWNIRWVHFYGNKLNEFMMDTGFHRSTLWSLKQLGLLEEAHQQLMEEAERHVLLHDTRLSTLTYALLTEFMMQAVPFMPAKANAPSTVRIDELLPRMQEQACQPFDLDYWADQAGVSTYYFCKLFRKTTRMTPLSFVTLCRIQFSKERLLEQPDWPVKRIAEECGYPSASYFNKRFLEHEGMTPTEFRDLYSRRSFI
ncbi:helix-turn-helix domain-containing protein [Paenibacillus sp. J2TS4]|uniref:AraC family transcriptional regulator n=1 Tax=Paenibacillus sp. J2TS4 TaxID=2807194 RepID=UPI001B1ECD84|nr:helix-turn-helix domain-containing protein [Paenibacillus sp. J2TS4]GIP34794.1 hypothetical protein J2TS4_40040 [Paenibacillus sp. J2TS4]